MTQDYTNNKTVKLIGGRNRLKLKQNSSKYEEDDFVVISGISDLDLE